MKIEAIETAITGLAPNVCFIQVHTDEGLVGVGDSYHTPHALSAYIHEALAPRMIGQDVRDINRFYYELVRRRSARWGGIGLEVRAFSALEIALWDLMGQQRGAPIFEMLGGRFREKVDVYNTCGGPGHGIEGDHMSRERYEDAKRFLNDPAGLAEELVAEGFAGMKIWPFDPYVPKSKGRWINDADLTEGLRVFAAIREAVGDQIDIMLEAHGGWDVPTAVRILTALEEFRPAWAEDVVMAHYPHALRQVREATSVPIVASENLVTKERYLPLLEEHAMDYVMVDPTWVGGIQESVGLAAMADAYGLPVTFHDCSGPVNLMASIHLSTALPNVYYQETCRAFMRTWYPAVVEGMPEVKDGTMVVPEAPGLGIRLKSEVFGEDSSVQVTRG